MRTAGSLASLIGGTDLVKIPSLSKLANCNIWVKCEFQNPGGSVKDRAALQMVIDAMNAGELKPGMTIVEGTAGNTGIGLTLVAKSMGFNANIVMPEGQTLEKQNMISLLGGQLTLVPATGFADNNHFYHTAKRMAEENDNFWWANQFENLSNSTAHKLTGSEIFKQLDGNIDAFVSVAGTGGTISGVSQFLKEQSDAIKIVSVDPYGSGIFNYLNSGKHVATQGSSMTEGIGIMRLVANFAEAKIDYALSLSDIDVVTVANYVRQQDGLLLGSSSALNVAGAFCAALKLNQQSSEINNVATLACDLGERSASKLYNPAYLKDKNLEDNLPTIEQLRKDYLSDKVNMALVNYNL